MYTLNKNIRVGDIILVDSNTTIAAGIKAQAFGEYSHAAIVISNTQLIEALGDSGVQISSLLRYEVNDIHNLAVYRAKDIDEEKFTNLIDEAIEHQGKSYDLAGTLKSIFPFSKTKESKFFCSELVAHLYNKIGIKLFDKDSAQVKPNDFTKCDKLINVSSEAISELAPHIKQRFAKRPHLWRPIDNKHSSVSPDALRHQKFLKDAQKAFQKRNLDIPDNVNDIIEIITRPHENGTIYLDCVLSNELMTLHNEHRILEEIDADINKEIDDDLDDYQKELDELGVEFAIKELALYLYFLKEHKNKMLEKAQKAEELYKIFEKFPLNIIKARSTYFYIIAEGSNKLINNKIEPTIDCLKKYIKINLIQGLKKKR